MLKKWMTILMCGILFYTTFSIDLVQAASSEETDENLELTDVDGEFVKFMYGLEQLPKGIESQGAEKVAKWLTNKTG